MLDVYAAWIEGSRESDLEAIRLAMKSSPRALEVLKRHLVLRARLKLQGKIDHEDLFFRDDGRPIVDLNHPYDRWRWTLRVTLKSRYREPYSARHSCVSWNLMLGKNLLWVAKQHGQCPDDARCLRCLDRRLEGVRPRSDPASDGVKPSCAGENRGRRRGRRHGRGVSAIALNILGRRTVSDRREPSSRGPRSTPRIWH